MESQTHDEILKPFVRSNKDFFVGDMEDLTLNNNSFRRVLFTTPHEQLVVQSLRPNEEVGIEIHDDTTQFFRFEHGDGQVILNDQVFDIHADDSVIVPPSVKHNIVNTSSETTLKFYTIYSPPKHKDGLVQDLKPSEHAEHEKEARESSQGGNDNVQLPVEQSVQQTVERQVDHSDVYQADKQVPKHESVNSGSSVSQQGGSFKIKNLYVKGRTDYHKLSIM